MAERERKQVEHLPQGWVWVYKGEEAWTTSQGKVSTERHAKNLLSGDTLSVKQAQKQQRIRRAEIGQPKPAAIKRTGKIRTQRYTGERREAPPKKGVKFRKTPNTNVHGNIHVYTFRTLEDAQAWLQAGNVPANFRAALIQARYTVALGIAKAGSDPYKKHGGYVNLTGYTDIDILVRGISRAGFAPWEQARERLTEFDMTGDNARIYIYAVER